MKIPLKMESSFQKYNKIVQIGNLVSTSLANNMLHWWGSECNDYLDSDVIENQIEIFVFPHQM